MTPEIMGRCAKSRSPGFAWLPSSSLGTSGRTALVNQIRGFLAERGLVLPKGVNTVRKQLPRILEDADNALTPTSRELFSEQYQRLVAIENGLFNHSDHQLQVLQENTVSVSYD